MSIVKGCYAKRISKSIASEDISDFLKASLREISDDLSNDKLPAILIDNIVTSIVSKKPSDLLIDLGIFERDKKLIEHQYDYSVICSYDEVKRFRSSATLENYKNANCVLRSHIEVLVQAVAESFDRDISSQIGKMQTYSLALLTTQPITENGSSDGETETFMRLKKSDIKDTAIPDTISYHYTGPKKLKMPPEEVKPEAFSTEMIEEQVTIKKISQELDLEFFQAIATKSGIPEYSGYNTKERREKGVSCGKKTKCMYTPLIDLTPSDPSTMMTAMVEAERLTNMTGQTNTIFTADQQLYKVLVDIEWAYSGRFRHFIPCLKGMHLLMSFIGCIGSLMSTSGLEEVLKKTCRGGENVNRQKIPYEPESTANGC